MNRSYEEWQEYFRHIAENFSERMAIFNANKLHRVLRRRIKRYIRTRPWKT